MSGLLVCAVLGACSSDTAPVSTLPPVDHDVQGSWGEPSFVPSPGSYFVMALTEDAGSVAGTGTFAGEAAPYGGLVVSGTVANDSLHLRIIFTYDSTVFRLTPDTAQFAGVLVQRDSISGQLTRDGFTSPLPLVRLMIRENRRD